ncbi:MAG TPA: STAS domain-containing protein [Adhaeribacter sp.]|nr:STAS domain-containing protein [Adhaeribacter sp.]
MQILTHVQQNSYIIALNGTLDNEHVPTVQNALINALQYHPKEVMVDCEELEEVTPTSLRRFISTVRSLQRNKIRFVLIGVDHRLHHLFNCLGVNAFTNHVASSSLIGNDRQCDIYFREI